MISLSTLTDNVVAHDGGGLGRRLGVFRLPKRIGIGASLWSIGSGTEVALICRFPSVTQADGHQAWTSPIYLIA